VAPLTNASRLNELWKKIAKPRIPQIEDYEPLIGFETVERIRKKAEAFRGLL